MVTLAGGGGDQREVATPKTSNECSFLEFTQGGNPPCCYGLHIT